MSNKNHNPIIGGIELGGITVVASISYKNDPSNILEKQVFKTNKPKDTLSQVANWFQSKNIAALGIASFGPIDICKESKSYGFITTTPKPNWENTDVVGFFRKSLKNGEKIPIGFQTDVNSASLAEVNCKIRENIKSCAYITVGGGIGVGFSFDKTPLKGLSHGEGGHIRVIRYSNNGNEDTFQGICKFHGNCIEGLVSAKALAKRLGIEENMLPEVTDNNEIWDMFGYYIGQLCANIILFVCPEIIVLGGGVFQRKELFDIVRVECKKFIGDYIQHDKIANNIDNYIIPAYYNDNMAGVVGSLEMAIEEMKK